MTHFQRQQKVVFNGKFTADTETMVEGSDILVEGLVLNALCIKSHRYAIINYGA